MEAAWQPMTSPAISTSAAHTRQASRHGGDAIAFLTDITGVPQVWQVPSGGGWPEQLTFFADRVSFVEYARTIERAAIGMDVGRQRTHPALPADGGWRAVHPPDSRGARCDPYVWWLVAPMGQRSRSARTAAVRPTSMSTCGASGRTARARRAVCSRARACIPSWAGGQTAPG